MSSINLYEHEVARRRRKVESEGKKQADESKKAADAHKRAADYEDDANRTRSASIRKSKLDQAARKRDEATKHRSMAAKAGSDKTRAEGDLHAAQRKLDDARAKADEKRRKDEARDRERAERRRAEQERRAQAEQRRRDDERDREIARLQVQASETRARLHEHLSSEAPAAITVLFVAASPENETPLRLDQEVREVQRRLRESEHRESVQFQWRPATQLPDLVQILNEIRPHVVHFSGHGSQGGLVFENDEGRAVTLLNDQLAALLRVTVDRLRVVVFNSCDSSTQAELACLELESAIGMDEPISDQAAQVFAGQLYNAIGFGKSLKQAFEQALVHTRLTLGDGSGLGEPQLHTAAGVDPAEIYLVKPPVACGAGEEDV